jgi:hypothetical protein
VLLPFSTFTWIEFLASTTSLQAREQEEKEKLSLNLIQQLLINKDTSVSHYLYPSTPPTPLSIPSPNPTTYWSRRRSRISQKQKQNTHTHTHTNTPTNTTSTKTTRNKKIIPHSSFISCTQKFPPSCSVSCTPRNTQACNKQTIAQEKTKMSLYKTPFLSSSSSSSSSSPPSLPLFLPSLSFFCFLPQSFPLLSFLPSYLSFFSFLFLPP